MFTVYAIYGESIDKIYTVKTPDFLHCCPT